MCGIAGFFSFGTPLADAAVKLEKMLAAIRHRGPDGSGSDIGPWYALGHLRLSILDTSDHAQQPMYAEEGRYALIYNGEIYNYLSLREQLVSLGYQFHSTGDTEVLLYGLIEWGPRFLLKLEGMFAGAFLDKKKNECLLFRDPLGIKPLYIAERAGCLAFASEVKALWPLMGHAELNEDALYEQFHFRTVSGERTLFRNIGRLLPGQYMIVSSDGRTDSHRYYDITDHISDSPSRYIDLHSAKRLLDRSIYSHTVSDVGYAVQLSGGTDSTYITNLLSKNRAELEAYAITLPNTDLDESHFQTLVAGQCGVKLYQYPCSGKDFADLLPEVTYHLDFPLMHGGNTFLYYLCKQIREKHKVVLTGEGADELLSGYSRYRISSVKKLAYALTRMGFTPRHIPEIPKLRTLKKFMSRNLLADSGSFSMPLMPDLCLAQGSLPYHEKNMSKFHTLMGRMMAVDQTSYLGSLLERQDKISMAHSVEVRVPFCNPRLFEVFNAIHPKQKMAGNVTKAILKKLLEPDYEADFIYRPKNGFTLPFAKWLRESDGLGRYIDLLRDARFQSFSFINHEILSRCVDAHIKGEADHSKEILIMISFAVWADQHKV